MDTPPLYLLYNTNYPPKQPNPADGQQLSTMVLCFIALGAFIAFLLIVGLIILIYNLCRYGTCCPPSAYPGCCNCCCPSPGCGPCYCATCCDQPPGGAEIVKPYPSIRSVRSSSFGRGSYVGRGTRFNQATYVVDPGTIRSDTLGRRRRNSIIVVDSGTLPRRRRSIGAAPARPQIIVANSLPEPCRGLSTVARRSLRALPGPSSSSVAQGCNTRCAPVVSTGNLFGGGGSGGGDDDGDIRVIVRNQPYASRSSIIEVPPTTVIGMSYNSSGFDNFNTYQSGGGGAGGGGGYSIGGGGGGYSIGGGGGMSNIGYDCGCGGQQQQSTATLDVHFGQVPEYTSDIGVVQQGSTIYPSLSQPGCY